MNSPRGRIPSMADAVVAFDNLVDRKLPARDEAAHTYFTLSGLWIAGGALATEMTAEYIGKGGDKLEIAASIGATCLTALTSGVFWRQGWRAQGEM